MKESKRIEEENKMFAKRLFEKNAYLSTRKMDEDFNIHEKYKKQIQKVSKNKISKHQGRVNHLPPLVKETEGSGTQRTANKLDNIEEETEKLTSTLEKNDKKKEIVSQKSGLSPSKNTKSDILLHKEISVSQLERQTEIFTKPLDKKETSQKNFQSKEKLSEQSRGRTNEIPKKDASKKELSLKAETTEESRKEEIKQELNTQTSVKQIAKNESKKEIKQDQKLENANTPDEKNMESKYAEILKDIKQSDEPKNEEKADKGLSHAQSQKSNIEEVKEKEIEEEKQEIVTEPQEEKITKVLSTKKLSAMGFNDGEISPDRLEMKDNQAANTLEKQPSLITNTQSVKKLEVENEEEKSEEVIEKDEGGGIDLFE